MTRERMNELADEIVTFKDGVVTIDEELLEKGYRELLSERNSDTDTIVPALIQAYYDDRVVEFVLEHGGNV